jgi:hypothetical protein
MALVDMKVFNQYVREATIETLAQMVDKFNAASGGAIQLSTEGFGGDFVTRPIPAHPTPTWLSCNTTRSRLLVVSALSPGNLHS